MCLNKLGFHFTKIDWKGIPVDLYEDLLNRIALINMILGYTRGPLGKSSVTGEPIITGIIRQRIVKEINNRVEITYQRGIGYSVRCKGEINTHDRT
jgi:hypothetical protein